MHQVFGEFNYLSGTVLLRSNLCSKWKTAPENWSRLQSRNSERLQNFLTCFCPVRHKGFESSIG